MGGNADQQHKHIDFIGGSEMNKELWTHAIEALIQDGLLARVGSNPRGMAVQARQELAQLKAENEKTFDSVGKENRELQSELARLRADLEAMEIEINKLDLNEALNARWVANGCRTFREYRDEWVEKQGKSVGVFRECAFPLGMVGNWIYRAETAEKKLAIALARIEAEKAAREPSLEPH